VGSHLLESGFICEAAMIEKTKNYAHAFKDGNRDQQYKGFLALCEHIEGIYSEIGKLPIKFVDGIGTHSAAVLPAAAQFAVQGIDGKFLIAIVNPQNILPVSPAILSALMRAGLNRQLTPILHNVQSSLDINFDNNSSLVDYGISPQLAYEIQNPNVTRFFRLRSTYDGKNWNDWQIYSSSLTCGPVGVYSGLLSSPALSFLNSTAMTADGSIAISQSGTSTTILIAAKTWNVGPQQLAYLGGSVDPGAYGKYYIYGIDAKKAGGAITYLATQNLGDLSAQDGIIQFGSITTLAGGGGGGSYGGFCCVAGVEVRMFNGSTKLIQQLLRGDVLLAPDGQPEVVQHDPEILPAQVCFRFEYEGRHFAGASAGELVRSNGHWTRLVDLAIGDTIETDAGPKVITAKECIGERTVYKLTLDRSLRYFGDGVVLHNMKIGP
jgi:hypothetical protein